MKKNFLIVVGFGLLLSSGTMLAQTKLSAKETALQIAERIISSTTYKFENKKTGEVFTTVKDLPLSADVQVQSVYNQWHYTNGVTNIALMELGDKLGDKKYEQYVLKNMNFVFNDGNYDYYKRLYDKTFAEGGWGVIRNLSWHINGFHIPT